MNKIKFFNWFSILNLYKKSDNKNYEGISNI